MILNSLAADDAANGPAMLRPLDQTTGLARLFVSAWGEAPLNPASPRLLASELQLIIYLLFNIYIPLAEKCLGRCRKVPALGKSGCGVVGAAGGFGAAPFPGRGIAFQGDGGKILRDALEQWHSFGNREQTPWLALGVDAWGRESLWEGRQGGTQPRSQTQSQP